jgi:glycosyltransferase involved in cell wall biosynthesis
MWDRFESFLAWLSEQPEVTYVCNADVPASPPRVLIATPYFKPHGGGVEEYAYQVARGLRDEKGWSVSVVTSGERSEASLGTYAGIKTYRLPYQLKVSNTPISLWWGRKLKRIIRVEHPDVIVAHAPVPGMLEVAAKRANKIPLVVTYHQGTMVKGAGREDALIRAYERLVLPRVLRKARRIICSSVFVQNFITGGRADHKTVVIYPGVDIDKFTFRATKPVGRRLLHVGGLATGLEHKGLETSLRVTAALKDIYADVRLSVVGQGDRRPYYEELARDLGISREVEFCGLLDGPEMVLAYQHADVLIVPSRKEAFGIVLIEAMACGTPVVAAAAEGILEVVQDGEGGVLVSSDDITGFVNEVSKIFDDPLLAQRFSEDGRRVVRERDFICAEQVNRTAEVLEDTIRFAPGVGSPPLRQSSGSAVNRHEGEAALG